MVLFFFGWLFAFRDLVSELETIGVEGLRALGSVGLADWFSRVVM